MSAPAERTHGLPSGHPRHAPGAGNGRSAVANGKLASRVDAACVRELGDGARIVAGNAGDHPLVLKLLVETHHAALSEDFQSRLDEPAYRPSDRLLVRCDQGVVAHVHVANHIGWFDGQRVPLVKLEDFAALPEFRHTRYEAELLRSAETIAASEGAVLALTHSREVDLFVKGGWSLLRGQGHTRANARAVLAHLNAQEAARKKRRKPPLHIRTWRHFELDAVRKVYEQTATGLWGPLLRSEAAWQWLIGRKAQDQILLAVDNHERSSEAGVDAPGPAGEVVGYAVVRGSCIIEMMTLAEWSTARTQLLARACHDAIDRDHHSISLYTAAGDPLHELLVTAGGAWISDASAGEPRWLAKLLAPEKWVERFYQTWHERARAGGVLRPFEVGFATGGDQFRFVLTRRSSRLERDGVSQRPTAHVECDRPTFESLLVGNLSLTAAAAAHQLLLSNPGLASQLQALFAPQLFWQSRLEMMRV